MNAFFRSQFNCNPLKWMFHSRKKQWKTNRLHERCLRIVYDDKKLSFQLLLEKDGSALIHSRNLQLLATEMFKKDKGFSTQLLNFIFQEKK